MSYLDDVAKAALEHCPGLLYELLPEGHISGRLYKCGSLRGGPGESTTVNLQTGEWGEWAGGPTGGKKWGLVSLYANVKGFKVGDALRELADRYGIKPAPRATSREQDWTAVIPVPASAYECKGDASPMLPDGILNLKPDIYWPYFDHDFNLLMFVVRVNRPTSGLNGKPKKDFYPLSYWRHKHGKVAWRKRELPHPRPLFNLESCFESVKKVMVVEGEKTVRAAERLLPDWWVTCWPGGSNASRYADWSPVRKLGTTAEVFLWPDNDPAGQSAMTEVSRQLGFPVHVIFPNAEWPVGYDLADLEKDGWTAERVQEHIGKGVQTIDVQPLPERPEIDFVGRDLYQHMHGVFEAMRTVDAPIYYYNDIVVYVYENAHGMAVIRQMQGREFRSWATEHLKTFTFTASGRVPCGISEDLGNAVIFNAGSNIPTLNRFAEIPIFDEHGNLIDSPGYHENARAYVTIPKGYDPEMPVDTAWELIDDLFQNFPFEAVSDKTAAVSFILTAVMRDRIKGPTPLYRFEAPSPGTGKSLLCEALCEIVTPFPQDHDLSKEPEEVRKTLTSALMLMPAVIRFDNVERMASPSLNRALTAYMWGDRILGGNLEVKIPVRNLWAATLNNPELTPEIFRRSVRVRLNAQIDHPESRPESSFIHHPLIPWVRKNRGILISAFVSVAKFGLESTASKLPSMGSYEDWVSILAPILETNGYKDFLEGRDEDREFSETEGVQAFRSFISKWVEQYGGERVSFSSLLELAQTIPALANRESRDGKIGARALGYLLRANRGRVIEGAHIQKAGRSGSSRAWQLLGKFPERSTEGLFTNDSNGQNSGI